MRRLCFLIGWLSFGSCAHAPSSHRAGGRLCAEATCYRPGPLDEKWQVIRQRRHEVAFFHPDLKAIIQLNLTCRNDGEVAPLNVLTNHLLIGYTERNTVREEWLTLFDREALHSTLEAKLDGVPVTLDLLVLKRDGCIVDISFAAPRARHAAGKAAFDRFVSGLTHEGRS